MGRGIAESLRYGTPKRVRNLIAGALLYGLKSDLSSLGLDEDGLIYVFSSSLIDEYRTLEHINDKYRYINVLAKAVQCREPFGLWAPSEVLCANNRIMVKNFVLPFIIEVEKNSDCIVYELYGLSGTKLGYRQFAKNNFTRYRLDAMASCGFFSREVYRLRIDGEDLLFKALRGERIDPADLI